MGQTRRRRDEQRERLAQFTDDPRLAAAVAFLGDNAGAREFQMRYSDDEQPVLWLAAARWQFLDGRPVADGGTSVWECAGATSPLHAVLRLAEQVVDGGACVHCHRPTGLDPDSIDTMPLEEHICWWQFDPELRKFRRGCEGDQT